MIVRLRIVLCELLRDDESLADHGAGGGEEREREPERHAQPLRLVREPVERVDDDEADGRERRETEEREHPGLGARVRRGVRNDPLLVVSP